MEKEHISLSKINKITTIITDLDGTLWQGILAEKQKIRLNERYFEFLKKIYKKGIQIFVVSKNDERDVLRAFKELGIDKELFTYVISNWDPKYINIERLLQQTNIRSETVIFVDDNPFERKEVQAKLPQLNSLDFIEWQNLEKNPYLNKKEEQQEREIRERINRYRTAINASELKHEIKEDAEFLKKLKRELSIGEISFENIDRFTRLLVVTHRINFNPEKFQHYDKALDYLYKKVNEDYKLFAISTRESDISLGLTGAIVVKIEGTKATIEDATFSCGIIGRDFEQKSILAFLDILKTKNIKEAKFLVKLTSTNKRVREIFEELGIKEKERKEDNIVYSVFMKDFSPKKTYDWIKVLKTSPETDYYGIPSIIEFFNKNVRPNIKKNFRIMNLGAAKGEVLGHLKKDLKKEFYGFIKENNITYTKVDIESLPEEKNIVANAEDLSKVIKDETQDLVVAIELLEHTEHFWKVINEIIRISKVGGYIFVSVPCFNYPKHEYPIDLWRIGPKTLLSFFPKASFEIIKHENEGDKNSPRRTLILVRKTKKIFTNYDVPKTGKTNWKTGITIFP